MELRTVNGKKQYGYLKKPLKDMLDFIVDELEKMPEVATYYSIWNDLRDTLESYYKSRSGQICPAPSIVNVLVYNGQPMLCGILPKHHALGLDTAAFPL